jgi:hypothetical protein
LSTTQEGIAEDVGDAGQVQATAARLRELLTDYAPYRRMWEQSRRDHQHQGREINQAMVCNVLAMYLCRTGDAENDVDLARRLRHRVSRALSGTVLSTKTLSWFVDAFGMSELHKAELWALLSGGDPARIVVVPAEDVMPDGQIHPIGYQTINLHEFHTVGRDGLPVAHRTLHMIRALEEVHSYSYRFDTDAAAVEVLRGGTASPVHRTVEPGIYAVEIVLHRPLAAGETASFEYRTVLNYSTPPPMEFRRACRRPVSNVEMHVQFDDELLPDAVWWATWDQLDGQVSCEKRVGLEPDGSVHQYVDSFEGIAGFRWTFGTRDPSGRRRR